MISKFVHLHLHTKYSMLDGMCKNDEIIDHCKKNNMSAVAITDHGNMFGIVEFYYDIINAGIKPIIGIELYIVDDIKKNTREKNHILFLVKDDVGYKNLIQLATFASTKGMYYKPTIDKKILSDYSKGLICLTSCIKGVIPSKILQNDFDGAKQEAEFYLKTFGEGNFYLELQNHNLEEEIIINRGLKELSKNLSIPLVVTNDVHYMNKEDEKVHELLLCIQTGQTIKNANRMQFRTKEFYFKNYDEIKQIFPDDEQAIGTTLDIANKCNFELPKPPKEKSYYMPAYSLKDSNLSYEEHFENITREAAKKKYKNITNEIKERLDYEINIIKKMGYASYFLIVKDIIDYAKKLNILVGPGRGSAAGSLVSYVLGITDVDPLKYGLIFERFLNPDRVTPPDIDIDFEDEGRDEIINFIINNFGEEKVAQIVTFQTLKPKQAIRDVGRVLEIPLKEVDELAKKVPEGINITFENVLSDEEFSEFFNENDKYKEIIKYAMRIEGLIRQYSTHAAGIVIAPDNLLNFVPLTIARTEEGEKKERLNYMTQYSMESLEKIGLVKFDILGLRNLTVIKNTVDLIKKNKGVEIHFENHDFTEKKVYELLSEGNTKGVFQLESESMRDILIKIKPSVFEEIIAIIALFRPGPMKMIDDYINRKKGNITKIDGIEDLKEMPILKETYGIPIYQEQVMQIAVSVAGFSLAEADNLRRVMAKKKMSEMEKIKEKFIDGAIKNKFDKRKAEAIFEKLDQFAQYGFNKSHATAYAILSYRTAFLKALYPLEYFTALLTSVMDKTDKIAEYVEDAKRNGIKILSPDINKSDVNFKIEKNMIRYGIGAIKNVGLIAAEEIINTRKEKGDFKDLFDFCEKVNTRVVNVKTVESLIKSGAFDFTLLPRAQLFNSIDEVFKQTEILHKNLNSGQTMLFDIEIERKIPETSVNWSDGEMLNYEKEVLGFYLSNHPLAKYEKLLKSTTIPLKDLKNVDDNEEVYVGGIVTKIKNKITHKGKENIHFTLEDLTGKVRIIISDKFPKNKIDLIEENVMLLIRGNLSYYDNELYIFAEGAITLDEAYKICKFLHIQIRELGLEEIELNEIKNVLKQNPGETEVVFHIITKNNKEIILSNPENIKITISEGLFTQLENIVGEDNIWVSWKK